MSAGAAWSWGVAAPSGGSQGHRRAISLWVGAASTSGGAMREPGGRDGGGSASEGDHGPGHPLTAENRRGGSCASPAILKPHLAAVAGLCSQDLHLTPGAPSCTEGHPGWGCDPVSRQGWRGGVLTERSNHFQIQLFKNFDKARRHWGLSTVHKPVNKLPTIAAC